MMFKKHTALAAAIMLAAAGTAMAESTPQTQFNFSGWPYRQETPCTTTVPVIPTERPLYPICTPTIPTDSVPTATPEPSAPTVTDAPATSLPEVTPQPTKTPTATRVPSTGDDYTTQSASMQEEMMLKLLNQDRAANGLAPLSLDPELSRIARIKSEDMRDNNYFAHESPTYGRVSDMLKRFGYAYTGAGENIAHHANAEKAQAAFMSSDGHRRNILSTAWEKVGIGICFDRNGYIYATQIFVR